MQVDRYGEDQVFYMENQDRRSNIYNLKEAGFSEEFEQEIRKKAQGVVGLVLLKKGDFLEHDKIQKTYRFTQAQTLAEWVKTETCHFIKTLDNDEKYELGEHEQYRDEVHKPFGTGFLVGRKWIVTAAHCFMKWDKKTKKKRFKNQKELNNIYVIFDFYMNRPNMTGKDFVFKEKDVYKIKEVIAQAYSRTKNSKRDFALAELRNVHPEELTLDAFIKLKQKDPRNLPKLKKIEGRSSLELISGYTEEQKWLKVGAPVCMLGHPHG